MKTVQYYNEMPVSQLEMLTKGIETALMESGKFSKHVDKCGVSFEFILDHAETFQIYNNAEWLPELEADSLFFNYNVIADGGCVFQTDSVSEIVDFLERQCKPFAVFRNSETGLYFDGRGFNADQWANGKRFEIADAFFTEKNFRLIWDCPVVMETH